MSVKWLDTTGYGSYATKSWSLRLNSLLTIGVHRHIDYPGQWLLTCYDLRIESHVLAAANADRAKQEALEYVKQRLESMTSALREFTEGA